MYPDDCYHPYITYSKVFFNKINNDKYKKFNDSKYIEIILNPGQILYIPPYWWFYIENLNRNIRLQLRGESYFSILIKFMFEKWPAILHKLSIYKKNNCTCC